MSELIPFDGSVETVASWVATPAEAMLWSGVTTWPVPTELFATWHSESDVVPFLLLVDGRAGAYGELWEDEDEVELARLLVAPDIRGTGVGRRLVAALVAEAGRRGFDEAWLRVIPENEPAIRCYLASGFVRATPEEEHDFNRLQPRAYAWMRHVP